jgi:ABC-type dipeptide/oligopeptide/nickel transport system permease component
MLEVLREDYIRTARSKGLTERVVIFLHGLKNACLPVITVSGWQLARLMGGTVIIESIFLVPGMGRLLVESIFQRDYPLIQVEVLVIAAMILFVNLLVDIGYGLLDPRIRYG